MPRMSFRARCFNDVSWVALTPPEPLEFAVRRVMPPTEALH